MLKRFPSLVAAICAALMLPSSAHALVTFFLASAPSLGAGAAVVAGGAIGGAAGVAVAANSDGFAQDAGVSLVTSSLIVLTVDPADATFYNGSFSIHFPSALLEPLDSGWLGDWGSDPSKLAPPVDPTGLFPSGTEFVIQRPNASLSASTTDDLVNGVETTTFSWGAGGHAVEGDGHFNFYAALFRVKQDLQITASDPSASIAPGSNLFTTNIGISCSAPGSSVMQQCGSPTSRSYTLTASPVPESSTFLMMLPGFGILSVLLRQRRLGSNSRGRF